MSENSIKISIERIVDIFKQDFKKNTIDSFLYNRFKNPSETAEKDKKVENTSDVNKELNIKTKKKIQDFLSTNKSGRVESISAKMLLELCEYKEEWRTPITEIFSSSIDIDNNIGELEELLIKIDKDALIPLKIEIHTGATLYIRYRKDWKSIIEYIFYYPSIADIAKIDGHKRTDGEVTSGYRIYRAYNEAKKEFEQYLDEIEEDYEDLNEFHLSETFQKQYEMFLTKKSLDDIMGNMDNYSSQSNYDYD